MKYLCLIIVVCFFGCNEPHYLQSSHTTLYNLQVNGDCGDFESDINGIDGGQWTLQHDTISKQGDSSLLLNKNFTALTSWFCITEDSFDVTPFENYVATAWVKVDAPNATAGASVVLTPVENVSYIVNSGWGLAQGSNWFKLMTTIPAMSPQKGNLIHMRLGEGFLNDSARVNIDVFKIWGVQGTNDICEALGDTLLDDPPD